MRSRPEAGTRLAVACKFGQAGRQTLRWCHAVRARASEILRAYGASSCRRKRRRCDARCRWPRHQATRRCRSNSSVLMWRCVGCVPGLETCCRQAAPPLLPLAFHQPICSCAAEGDSCRVNVSRVWHVRPSPRSTAFCICLPPVRHGMSIDLGRPPPGGPRLQQRWCSMSVTASGEGRRGVAP